MEYSAFYFDGQTASRNEVLLSYKNKLLLVFNEGGDCLATWDVSKIVPIDRVDPDYPLILGCENKKNERLHIHETETRNWLFNILPGLTKRSAYKKENRLAWVLSGFAILGTAALYFLLPVFSQLIVHLIPLKWERDFFAGAGVQVAKTLGAKQQCNMPEGVDTLDRLLVRLVGKDKAQELNVLVVDHRMVNAFATPGQNIVLMSGLIKNAASPEEVAGILAHEIGHVVERHPVQGAIRQAGLTLLLSLISSGSFADITTFLAETSYSREHEKAADLFALKVLKNADIKTDGLVAFFKRLEKDERALKSILGFISTHPASHERALMLQAQKGGDIALTTAEWEKLKNICASKKVL